MGWKKLISDECKLKGYSKRTIENYTHHIEKYLQSKKSPREYLLYLINKNKSDETVRSAGFAIKFYLKASKQDSEIIEKIIGDILIKDVPSNEFGLVTVTNVKCTPDLMEAKVYLSIYNKDPKLKAKGVQRIKKKASYIPLEFFVFVLQSYQRFHHISYLTVFLHWFHLF